MAFITIRWNFHYNLQIWYGILSGNDNGTGFQQLLENLEKWQQFFPVLEKYWNFIILLKILEKWEWTWKNELSGKNSFKLIVATFISAV